MNKKFLFVSVFALLLGTTSVMADNHRDNDGPKHKKEVVQKNNKKDNKKNNKKDKVGKNDRHFNSKAKPAHKPAPKPVAHKAPAKHKPAVHPHKPHHKPDCKPVCRPDGRHSKSCFNCHKGHCHHGSHCRPVAPCHSVKKHVRITPPFSPIQVTVRI